MTYLGLTAGVLTDDLPATPMPPLGLWDIRVLGFRASRSRVGSSCVQGLGLRLQGLEGFRVGLLGLGFKLQGLGFRV